MFDRDPEARRYGFTAVENRFLMDFLPAAKGDYVKVYLWGLYACDCLGAEYSLTDMAADLDMSQAELEAALRYWERRALVSRISDNPPQYRFYSAVQRQAASGAPLQVDGEYVEFSESVYAVFGDRRKINTGEIALAWEWVQDIGLKTEVVLMLLHHCIAQRGVQFSFKKAQPLAVRMKEHGVTTCDDADNFLRHEQTVHDGARKVLSRMGKRRLASEDELTLYEKWLDEWGFSPDAVLDACAETTKGDPSFKYLDGILNGLRSRGAARTSDQVKKQLAQEADEKALAQRVLDRLGVRLAAPAAVRFYRQLLEIQPHEVVLLGAEYCSRAGRKSVEDLQDLLTALKNRGLISETAVREYLGKVQQTNQAVQALFDACGHHGRPTAADRALYEKWRGWGMDQELLAFAAEQSRAAEGNKLAYLNKVLEMWHEAGITDISQARSNKKPAGAAGGKVVSAQQYTQREYTEEELLAVSEDLIEEARRQRE